MGDVIPFKKKPLSDKFQGSGLCRDGFHKWRAVKNNHFDIKQGKLVTLYQCTRCGKQKVKAD